jgi:hypothetical protein
MSSADSAAIGDGTGDADGEYVKLLLSSPVSLVLLLCCSSTSMTRIFAVEAIVDGDAVDEDDDI